MTTESGMFHNSKNNEITKTQKCLHEKSVLENNCHNCGTRGARRSVIQLLTECVFSALESDRWLFAQRLTNHKFRTLFAFRIHISIICFCCSHNSLAPTSI